MDVEPKSDEQTSPEILADVENTFKSKYPIAIEDTERMARALSPCTFFLLLIPRSKTETRIVIGRTITRLFEMDKTVAIERAPKET